MPRATKAKGSAPAKKSSKMTSKESLKVDSHPKVIPFYSDREGNPFREFSNFYRDAPPFQFVLPEYARRDGLPDTIQCEFSEKAIMLAKAGMMGDIEAFHEISEAKFPKDAKDLGRGVRDFDQELWNAHLEKLAFEVVRQKFDSCKKLRAVLLSTGDALLVEAAPNDSIWGVGLRITDDRVYHPSQWCGQNILGYSLMRARSILRGETMYPPFSSPNSSDVGVCTAGAAADCHSFEDTKAEHTKPQCGDVGIDQDETFLRPISDLDAVRDCYARYGVVGVTGVLSEDECKTLITDGLEPHLPDGCRMDDPSTYSLADDSINRYGVIGKSALFNPAILSARLHPNVVAAYSAVHGREDVYACHDRAAWMRPVALNPSWDTPFSWPGLHFDVSLSNYFNGDRSSVDAFLTEVDYDKGNFVAENNAKHVSMGRTVQGVLNLFDNNDEDGGFQCVPGMFGSRLQQWVSKHPALPNPEPNGRYELRNFGADVEISKGTFRIPCPPGTLILFDATLPHGTKPNCSDKSRAILFLRYITSDELPNATWTNRNAALKRILDTCGFEPTVEQLKHLYGPGTICSGSSLDQTQEER
eukprot:gnl/MRDRNA2_/MRDRNA2_35365_c0_seq1.p1 gnl/MRDRNA2_/MRDRNA2_35365_c0~~gnl/MRDRNA2_/MRDRNA2_35365_c0_seq1.p1  ORF type:complete len:586 (+),score=92.45 gnl/MRDRNA2_/MRDRNA2_35365_c0_seq1:93-1850(+)